MLSKKIYTKFKNLYYRNNYCDINKKLINIQNNLSIYNIELIKFYLYSDNYITSFNRANFLINKYAQNKYILYILKILINSYSAIGKNKDSKKIFLLLINKK